METYGQTGEIQGYIITEDITRCNFFKKKYI